MQRRTAGWSIAVLAIFFSALPAVAQELAAGSWSGTISPPGEMGLDVEYNVSYDDGALQIDLIPPVGLGAPESIPFENIELIEGILSFEWSAGTPLTCQLFQQDDGSFEGECVDTGGSPGVLVMVPPDA